jgi:hypothetical protein
MLTKLMTLPEHELDAALERSPLVTKSITSMVTPITTNVATYGLSLAK